MKDNNIPNNHPHIWFSQLLGMSDHISFNMAAEGYNVAKYVPYGPVKNVLPYLIRRAQENTSVKGQTGRELSLIIKEKQRRATLAK
jgi:proline dehydrogenase